MIFTLKLGPVTYFEKENITTSKNFEGDVTSANYDIIVIFPIYGWFGTIRNPHSGRMVYDSYISVDINFLSYKKWQ